MAYFREYRNKHGALIRRALILTAKDNKLTHARRLNQYGCPAWQTLRHFQNTRESWRFYAMPPTDNEIVAIVHDLETHLAVYRQRYQSNLRVKHGRGELQYYFKIGNVGVFNGALDLSLDQASIDNTIRELRYWRRLARAYGVSL